MSLSRKDILASARALLLVLVAVVVSNWSSLTSSVTTSIIPSNLADHARAVRRSALPLPDRLRLLGHLDAQGANQIPRLLGGDGLVSRDDSVLSARQRSPG
jgi:hypothetical protein